MNSRSDTGRISEEAAAVWLRKKNYRIIERNWRCFLGEIDLVAFSGTVVCFIEVRSRRAVSDHSWALESIHEKKQRRLRRLAEFFLKEKGWEDRRVRFDVVSVLSGSEAGEFEILLLENAF